MPLSSLFRNTWLRRRIADKPRGMSSFRVESLEERLVLTYGPLNTDLLVNTDNTVGAQVNSSISTNYNGQSVLVWQSDDGDGQGVFAQRYTAQGILAGPIFRVNTTTANDQTHPQVAVSTSGDFTVIWQSEGQDGSGSGIYGQNYLANGTKLGGEFRVNTYTQGNQQNPRMTIFTDGINVIWESDGQDGDGLGVFGQRYLWKSDHTLSTTYSEFQANLNTVGDQKNGVAMDNTNGFAVAYEDYGIKGNGNSAIIVRNWGVNKNGGGVAFQGPAFQIAQSTSNQQKAPAIITGPSNRVTIAWQSDHENAGDYDIYLRTFYSSYGNTTFFTDEIRANDNTDGSQTNPSMSVDGYVTPSTSRRIIVTWEHQDNVTGDKDIYGRPFDYLTTPIATDFRVNNVTSNDQLNPSISSDRYGYSYVTYTSLNQVSGTSSFDIYRQILTDFTNLPPVANAGGPYTTPVVVGVKLNGSGTTDPNPGQLLDYTWDINGDGVFGDAVGSTPTLTWAALSALGISAAGTWNVQLRVTDSFGASSTAQTTLTVAPNTPPVANAGGPYSVPYLRALNLNASSSSDADVGQTISYSWDINGDGIFGEATGVSPMILWSTLVSLGLGTEIPETRYVSVRVTDSYGASTTSAPVALNILPNLPPVFSTSGVTITYIQGSPLNLTAAAATDPEHDPLSYTWDFNGDGIFGDGGSQDATENATFTWSELQTLGIAQTVGTVYNFRLKATDLAGNSAISPPTKVTVIASSPPTAQLRGPFSVIPGNKLILDAIGSSDPDPGQNQSLTYSYDLNGDGVFGDFVTGASRPDVTWSQLVAMGFTINGGVYNIKVRVTDIVGKSATSAASTLTIYPDTLPIVSLNGPYVITEQTGYLSLAPTISDPDPGQTLTYSWDINGDGVFGDLTQANAGLDWNQLTQLGIPTGASLRYVRLKVTDSVGGVTITDPVPFTVKANSAPIPFLNGPFIVTPGSSVTFSASAIEPDVGQYLSFSWDINGDGIFGDGNDTGGGSTFTWNQLLALGISPDNPDTRFVRVKVTDTLGASTISDPTTLTVIRSANEGDTFNFYANIPGVGNTYSLAPGSPPIGAAVDPVTGLVVWTLADNAVDPITLTINATDTFGVVTSKTFAVQTSNVAPTLTWSAPSSALRGELVPFTILPIDAITDQASNFMYMFDWNGDGVFEEQYARSASSPVVTHAYTTPGDYAVSIRVVDKDGAESNIVTHSIHIDPWKLVADPINPSLTNLVWSGTPGNDRFTFERTAPDQITVHTTLLNGVASSSTEIINGVTGKLIAYGQKGNDWLDASAINGMSVELRGNGGNDTLLGSSSDDVLYGDSDGGEGGSDSIVAGSGNDVVYADGSEGKSDIISGDLGDDEIYSDPIQGAEGGADAIDAGDGNDLVDSGKGNDTLIGGTGNDVLIGGLDPDTIQGSGGEDLMISASLATSYYAAGGLGIHQVWNQWRTSDPIAIRIDYLTGTPGGIIDSSYVLTPGTTLLNDTGVDTVVADDDADQDWIIADLSQDVIHQAVDDYFTDL